MAGLLYVLTTKLEGKNGYGPVAVTDSEHTANEWIRAGGDNDWTPLELNDLSGTGLAEKAVTPFKPVSPKVREQQRDETAEQTRKNLEEANRLLQEAVKRRSRVKSHAKKAGRRDEIKKHYEQRAQGILNDWLLEREDQDPDVHDFLDYLKTDYRANVPEDEYEILVDVLYTKYKAMFGPK
jgi:hypothetical protein